MSKGILRINILKLQSVDVAKLERGWSYPADATILAILPGGNIGTYDVAMTFTKEIEITNDEPASSGA